MVCCGNEEDDKVQKYQENRSCTDIPCCLLFIAFWAGYVAVASVGFKYGNPDKLLYGTDYLGNLCGTGVGPVGFSTKIPLGSRWQSPNWADNTKLWYPVPANISKSDFSLTEIMRQGVCVKECPMIDAATISLLTANSFNFFRLGDTVRNALSVATYGDINVQNAIVFAPERHYVSYNTVNFYRRCIPDGLQPQQLQQSLNKISGFSGVSNFFFRGINEVAASWRVFLVIGFIAMVFCFVWVFIMRFFVKPLTVLALIFVFCVIFVVGGLMYKQAERLANEQATGASNDKDYEKFWRYGAYITWSLSALYVVLIIFMWRKIDEACSMIKISGRVIASAPSLLSVPIFTSIAVMLVAAWGLAVAVYLYTCDDLASSVSKEVAVAQESLGNSRLNQTGVFDNRYSPPQFFVNVSSTYLEPDQAKRNLLFYDLFGFLWTMGFFGAIGYTIIAFCTVFWYFSDLDDEKKHVPVFSLCKALRWTFIYHLGTLAFGSLLIAIIQFVRIIMVVIVKRCEAVKRSDAAQCILCVVDCCLACFERIISIIARNAYIMMAIKSNSFFCAAKDAFNLIVDNATTIAILNFIAEIIIGLGKLLALLGCLCLSWTLMDDETMAPEVKTKIFPLILIGFMVYFIATVFFDVYSVIIDANFVCYHHDLKVNAGVGVYYFPKELESQMKNYDSKKKQAEYNQRQKAQAAGEPFPAQNPVARRE